ncbi:choline-sulfatase [Rhodoblastus sphagnicola]|uniref:Choline-sulfatase n=1 Tax=Rhodoblastus sphagnicola TaxID=333368 RepID=A0A2S6N8A2_9HYPH|nr:choline-sulfatase [Rhodoblastus sphagnicola]MBB4196741.1 choline-sulfatase [Rhodoblastus sphagnicola]PPQ30845.1 choline-sulfatase [Rhodoblastus sphagnicola]
MPASPPNLLIVVADQLTPGALPAYGNRVARTPHLDRLAARGVRFNRAYTNSPLCGPARASLLTGRLPAGIGAYDNACELRADLPTIGHHLRRAGYRTIISGKMHFVGPDQLHGFEERLTTDIYPADFTWTPDWTRPDHRPDWYHSMDSVLSAGPCARSNQIDFDEEVVFAARRKLFDLARFGAGRPFAMVVSLTHPHDPFNIGQAYWDRYAEDEIDPPGVPRQPNPDPHSARLRQVCGIDAEPVTEAQIRAARHAYYGAISFVDDQIGLLNQTLDESGLADNTITVFLSDHGEMLGERGLWYKMSFFEGACRIPLIVHAPSRFQPHVVEQAVSLVDLLPTLCDLGGAAPPAEIDGRSLLPHLEGAGGHDEVFGEYCAEGVVAPMVMIRRGRWKFIHAPGDPDQLYDLDADPDELENLADSAPEAKDFRAETARRWPLEAIKADVLASQGRRTLVADALRRGHPTAWDYQPPGTAATAYIRAHKPIERLEADCRLPSRLPPADTGRRQ